MAAVYMTVSGGVQKGHMSCLEAFGRIYSQERLLPGQIYFCYVLFILGQMAFVIRSLQHTFPLVPLLVAS